ncbi:MAG: tetratricopeptide repeat protein [Cyclobacteriaceae bacterium]
MRTFFILASLLSMNFCVGQTLLKDVFPNIESSSYNVQPIINLSDTSILNPDDYTGYMELGLDLYNQGAYHKAIQEFKKALLIHIESISDEFVTYNTANNNPYPYYYIGLSFEAIGTTDSAKYYIRKSLIEMPYFIEGLNRLGVLLLASDSITSAIYQFNQGLKINAKSDVLNYNLAYSYFLLGQKKQAKKLLNHNIELNPHYVKSYDLLAQLYLNSRKPNGALKVYNSAINTNPRNAEAYYSRANFYLSKNQLKEAKSDLEKSRAYSENQLNPYPNFIFGLIEIFEGDYYSGTLTVGEAIAPFADNILNQENPDYSDSEFLLLAIDATKQNVDSMEIELVGSLLSEVISENIPFDTKYKCEEYLKTNASSELVQRTLLYTQIATNSTIDKKLLGRIAENLSSPLVSFMLADKKYDYAEYNESLTLLKRITRKYPKYVKAHYYEGLVNYELDNYNEAIDCFDKATEVLPNYAKAYHERGRCYQNLKDYSKAIKDYRTTLTMTELNGWPYNNIGICHRNLGNEDSAVFYYNKSIEVSPDRPEAYFNIGLIQIDNQEYSGALKNLDMAISKNANKTWYLNKRGYTHFMLDHIDEAIADYNRCIDIYPENKYYITDLADVYTYLGEYEKATEYYENALEIDPQFSYPIKRIGDIEMAEENYAEAIQLYSTTVKLSPKYLSAVHDLGFAYIQIDQYDSALTYFHKALALDSTYSSAYGNAGWVHYLKGNFEMCIDYSVKAIDLNSSAYYAMFNIALSTLCQNQPEEARRKYKEYIEIAKKNNANTEGALTDLKDLIKNGVMADEAKSIINEFFIAN